MSTEVAVLPRPLGLRAAATNPVILLVAAAVLAGASNTAFRFGGDSVAALAATTSLLGLLLFTPLTVQVVRSGAAARLVRDPVALAACTLSAGSLWGVVLMLRTVPGPSAAAAMGILPVVVLLIGRLTGSRRTPARALPAILVAVAAALVAAGGAALSGTSALAPLLFLTVSATSLLVIEAARRKHPATAIVAGGLVIGALPAPFVWTGAGISTTGLFAAGTVAVLGTLSRLLKGHAQGFVSAAVTGTTHQVTALTTALGGVLLLGDSLTPTRLVALVVAAVAATLAVRWSSEPPATPVSQSPHQEQPWSK